MYLTNVISDTFAKSKLYLDYNLTEEESQNFTEFFKQYNRLLQILNTKRLWKQYNTYMTYTGLPYKYKKS